MNATIVIGALGTVLSAVSPTETQSFDARGMTGLEVKNGGGAIRVTTRDDGKATVTARKRRFGDNCELIMERRSNRLLVETDSKSTFGWSDCRVDFDIEVPRKIDIEIRSGSGKLSIEGTHGEVEFRVGSGQVTIDGEITELDGRSGSGELSVRGLTGKAELRTGSGDIVLTYTDVPKSGDLTIKTGSGDATIFLPASTVVDATLKAGSGRIKSDFPNPGGRGFRIVMKAGSGDLILRKR